MKSYKIITDASGVVELANYITQGNIIEIGRASCRERV